LQPPAVGPENEFDDHFKMNKCNQEYANKIETHQEWNARSENAE
jgi:hypothetical protein